MRIAGPRKSKVNLDLAFEINRREVRAMPAGIGAAVDGKSKSNLESRLIVASGQKIYAVLGDKKKEIAGRGKMVLALANHEGGLYDGGEEGLIYDTLDSPYDYTPWSARPGSVFFLASFRGVLHDGGIYNNVYDSLKDKDGKNPVVLLYGPCNDAIVCDDELLIAVLNNNRTLPSNYDTVVFTDILCNHKDETYYFNQKEADLCRLGQEQVIRKLPFICYTLVSNGATILAGAEIEVSDEEGESNAVDERRVVYAVVDALSEKFDRICEFDSQVNKILIPTPEVWQKIIDKYGEPK